VLLGIDVVCFAAAVGIHRILDALAKWAISEEMPMFLSVLHAVFAITFFAVYIRLLYDILQIFIPALRFGRQEINGTAASRVDIVGEEK